MGCRNHSSGEEEENKFKPSHEASSLAASDRGSEPWKISGWIGDSSRLENMHPYHQNKKALHSFTEHSKFLVSFIHSFIHISTDS